MSIADTLVKQIPTDKGWQKPAPLFDDDQFSKEILLPKDFISDGLALDAFRGREPDSLMNHTDSKLHHKRYRRHGNEAYRRSIADTQLATANQICPCLHHVKQAGHLPII